MDHIYLSRYEGYSEDLIHEIAGILGFNYTIKLFENHIKYILYLSRYEGYSVDLIHEIAGILGFNYTIKLVEDGSYGSYNKHTGKWNGMIGKNDQYI